MINWVQITGKAWLIVLYLCLFLDTLYQTVYIKFVQSLVLIDIPLMYTHSKVYILFLNKH
jgi:hypothetical protein